MAEFVEIDLEKCLGELHGLLDIDLFEKSEISKIYEQRRSNSYSLQKKTKDKDDFLRFLHYEENLLKRIAEKREKTGNKERIPDIDGKITSRLLTFFRHTLERYKADVDLWKEYFWFCERHKLKRTANKMLTRMLQVHGDKPDLWIFASRWAVNRVKNSDTDLESGRIWLVRGLERHPKNEELYTELIRYDCELSLREEDQRETALACAAVSFKNAVKTINNPRFFVDLLTLVSEYPHAEELNQQALTLVEAQADSEDAWKERALLELKKDETGLNACVTVFEKAVETLPTKKMWRMFVDFLKTHSKEPFLSVKLYKNVLPEMIEKRFADEEDFALLADYKLTHGKPSKALDLLKTGQEIFPNSCILLYEYLRINLTIGEEKLAVKEFLSCVDRLKDAPTDAVVRIWNMMINFFSQQGKHDTVEELFKNCVNGRIDVAQQLKPKYLQFRLLNGGINHARDLLKNPKIGFPPCLAFYKQLIEIEMAQPEVNGDFIRQQFETMARNFGKTDPDVWLDWITFEKSQKNYQKISKIHAQAMSTLTPTHADTFTTKYSLQF